MLVGRLDKVPPDHLGESLGEEVEYPVQAGVSHPRFSTPVEVQRFRFSIPIRFVHPLREGGVRMESNAIRTRVSEGM